MTARLYVVFQTADERGQVVDEENSQFYGLEFEAAAVPDVGEPVAVNGETRYVARRRWRLESAPREDKTIVYLYMCAKPPPAARRANQVQAERPPH